MYHSLYLGMPAKQQLLDSTSQYYLVLASTIIVLDSSVKFYLERALSKAHSGVYTPPNFKYCQFVFKFEIQILLNIWHASSNSSEISNSIRNSKFRQILRSIWNKLGVHIVNPPCLGLAEVYLTQIIFGCASEFLSQIHPCCAFVLMVLHQNFLLFFKFNIFQNLVHKKREQFVFGAWPGEKFLHFRCIHP